MATDKQVNILKKYLTFDSYCFMNVSKAAGFIDMIKKLENPSHIKLDISIKIREDVFPLIRKKANICFYTLCEETKDFIFNQKLKGVVVKEINYIRPMVTKIDEEILYQEVIFSNGQSMLLNEQGRILPSYFEVLKKNNLNNVMDIISLLSKEVLINEKK